MVERKSELKFGRIKFINVVLYPTVNQKPELYIELFKKIHSDKVTINTYGQRGTRLRTQFELVEANTHILYGNISNSLFVDPDADALNIETNEIVPNKFDENLSLDPRDWPYFFFANYHRFVFFDSSSEAQIVEFLTRAINNYYNEDQYSINIEKDRDKIQEIMNMPSLTKLEATISYSNNANNDGWAGAIDSELRDSETRKADFTFTGTKKTPFFIKMNSMLHGILKLTESYGNAYAAGYDEEGVVQKINTKDHPLTEQIEYRDSPISAIKEKIKCLFGKNNE